MKQKVDLIIRNVYAVTIDSQRRLIKDAVIVIKNDLIEAIGGNELLEVYFADENLDGQGMAAFPGLISTHTHLFQTVLRGLGRDKLLFDWLNASVRRAMRHIDQECCYYAAMAGCLESMRSGMTTTLDFMYCHGLPDTDEGVLKAFEDAGIRGVFGRAKTITETLPKEFACSHTDTEQAFFDDTERFIKRYQDHSRISVAIAPGIIWDLSEDGYRQTRRLANQYGIPITMHTLETVDDNAYCQKTFGEDTIPHLERLGVLGPDFIAVHCVDMKDRDFEIFKAYDVKVSHNPASNMILASGVAPVYRMLEEGACVSLGVDGAASNDSQNMLETLKLSALLQKATLRNPQAVPASQALEMATRMGAQALGMQAAIGSLEAGKKADILLFDCNQITTTPTYDPVCAMVYNAVPSNVDTLIIDGRAVLRKGEFVDLDEERIMARTREIGHSLTKKADLHNLQWGQKVDF